MKTPSDDDIKVLQQRVAANPQDLQLRYELGTAFCQRGDYQSAICELQLAVKDPNIRTLAMKRLSEAFEAIGLDDLKT